MFDSIEIYYTFYEIIFMLTAILFGAWTIRQCLVYFKRKWYFASGVFFMITAQTIALLFSLNLHTFL